MRIAIFSMLDTTEQPISSELQRKINRLYTCLHRSGYGKGPHKVRSDFISFFRWKLKFSGYGSVVLAYCRMHSTKFWLQAPRLWSEPGWASFSMMKLGKFKKNFNSSLFIEFAFVPYFIISSIRCFRTSNFQFGLRGSFPWTILPAVPWTFQPPLWSVRVFRRQSIHRPDQHYVQIR